MGGERVKLNSTCTQQQQIAFLAYGSLVQVSLQSAGPQSHDHLVAQGSGELSCYEKSGHHPSWAPNQNEQIIRNSPLFLPASFPFPVLSQLWSPNQETPNDWVWSQKPCPLTSRNVDSGTIPTHTRTHSPVSYSTSVIYTCAQS